MQSASIFNTAVNIIGLGILLLIHLSYLTAETGRSKAFIILTRMGLALGLNLICSMLISLVSGKPEYVLLQYGLHAVTYSMRYVFLLHQFCFLRLSLQLQAQRAAPCMGYTVTVSTIMILLVITDPLHGALFTISAETGMYSRGPLYFLHVLFLLSLVLMYCFLILKARLASAKKRNYLISSCLISAVMITVQHLANNRIQAANIGLLFSLLTLYLTLQLEQQQDLARTVLDLENAHAALVLSQIQPHFLFNSLTSIMSLCNTDPKEARDALQELSDYLHYKISAMSHSYVVPFAEDLEYLTNYVNLEKRRYGDRLQVSYDLPYQDFQIPLLTLQPLVENAIRHGISRKPEGGTVTVSTSQTETDWVILVRDDGVGFDPSAIPEDSREHVGLQNVRHRLAALCSGSFQIQSTPGIGTTVTITIRKDNIG